ncbi:dUTP diphosphatase [Heliobacterium chlorum]|uniref:dUTP diphosphatase n=1 Tax=Heliobacterium chlorum TaxID=2698 RepID=A0ABR7T735_HELCL|nr:dUTP diphosphatase [Heliobacterium chlorum]MBC9786575.1 dUTP diphosphatase [Heliobacterium chlorum]
MNIFVKRLHPNTLIPERQTPLASGFDLHVLDAVSPRKASAPYNDNFKSVLLLPSDRILVRTGIALQLPMGMEAQVRPRSGLALKHGVTVLNTPGTIDADYIGDIGVILINLGDVPIDILKGDRVAQLVFQPVFHDAVFLESEKLDKTERNSAGFGHTGRRTSNGI